MEFSRHLRNRGNGMEQASSDAGTHERIRVHRSPRVGSANDKCIHQCEHWFMHRPPACANRIRILSRDGKSHPGWDGFF